MTPQAALKQFRAHGGLLRTTQAIALGIPAHLLYQLHQAGKLTLLSRGLYCLANQALPAHLDLLIVAKRVPQAVICLISALSFYELTTEIPHEVHLALPGPGTAKGRQPQLDYPPSHTYRFSGLAFSEGINTVAVGGNSIKIYSPAKTVADCFKFRNQIGFDVALEALKLFRNQPTFKIPELLKFARICRVERIMRPYLEALV